MSIVLIHYFSGTGNTLLAASQLSEELTKQGCQPILHSIEEGIHKSHKNVDMHLFLFPIYATSVPHLMSQYILDLPRGKGVLAGVITTNGRISKRFRDGYQGWALHQARLILKFKNYKPFISETLDYPHNITVAFPARNKEANREIIAQASEKLPELARKIAKHEKSHRGFFWPNIVWSLPFGLLYSYFGRFMLGKLFVTDGSCNLCGHCVQNCPTQTIKIWGNEIYWGRKCEGCLRCFNRCPSRAIQISVMRFVVVMVALVWIIIQKNFLLVFCLMFVVGPFFIFCSHIPGLRRIMKWGYTRRYGRYQAKDYEDYFLNQ